MGLAVEADARSRFPGCWYGKHEQWDREIHEGSDLLPSQGKSRSANERTHNFQSTVGRDGLTAADLQDTFREKSAINFANANGPCPWFLV